MWMQTGWVKVEGNGGDEEVSDGDHRWIGSDTHSWAPIWGDVSSVLCLHLHELCDFTRQHGDRKSRHQHQDCKDHGAERREKDTHL